MRAKLLQLVRLFETLWNVACQAPLSMEFSSNKYWSGLPFPSLADLLDPGIEPMSLTFPTLAGGFFATNAIYFTCGHVHVPMLFSQIIAPLPYFTESKSLIFIPVSPLLLCM